MRETAYLVTLKGEVFEGEAAGSLSKDQVASGELVFNTSISGYQEIVSDPSYAGQIISFTYPHIGNYGVNSFDNESKSIFANGVVVKDLDVRESNWRGERSFEQWLKDNEVPAITGIDTRRLTTHIRSDGAMPCVFGVESIENLKSKLNKSLSTDGKDLVSSVSTKNVFKYGSGKWKVVAYDFGIKETILRHLSSIATVYVVPARTSYEEVMSGDISEGTLDGVFLSNGPGDPAALVDIALNVKKYIGNVPVFGICLGHQLLSIAQGASTEKLPFGHHGANHPVRRIVNGQIEITSHNHNYAVSHESAKSLGLKITHENLNDGVVEGISSEDEFCFSVQYHPEAGPGPHDASYLFDEFNQLMERFHAKKR